MRIGIDARMYGMGFTGIGRYTAELVDHLSTMDGEHEFVLFMRKEAFDSFTPPNERFSKVMADFPHYSMGEQIGFLKLLNAQRLDLMHFTHFNAPLLYSRPFVVTIHDLTLSFFPGKKMTSLIHRLGYQAVIRSVTRKAKVIIAVSQNTKKDLISLLGIPDEKVRVIHNGVSPKFTGVGVTTRQELMQKLGLQKPFFLYTGVWRDHKNLVGMIRAFASFNKKAGGQYDLVITGAPNSTYHEVPDTVKELSAGDQVHLVGLVSEEDLAGLYQNAFCYVFPSFYEGFGLPPLEAMACGLPVIASNTSATPEICGEGNALFFDPKSLEDMEDKMRMIASDPTLRQRLVERGHERVKDFRWDKMTDEVLSVYNQLVK